MAIKAKGGGSPRRRSGDSHYSCSQKRTVLKERIRELESRVLNQAGSISVMGSDISALYSMIAPEDHPAWKEKLDAEEE